MQSHAHLYGCLLYKSDAADELTRVDLGGRRVIKKKNNLRRKECAEKKQQDSETSTKRPL